MFSKTRGALLDSLEFSQKINLISKLSSMNMDIRTNILAENLAELEKKPMQVLAVLGLWAIARN